MKKNIRTIILAVILAVPAFFVTVRKPPRTDMPEFMQYEEEPAEGENAVEEPIDTESIEEEAIGAEPAETGAADAEHFNEPSAEEPSVPELSFEPMLISTSEAVVYSYTELKSALEQDNGINTVYFGGDITMQLGGIRINPAKRDITVSGLNPLEPERSEPYTLTDYSSASFYSTVYIDADGVSKLHIRDMNIVGKNYYGPFSILDSASLADVSLIYDNVSYNGPQLCYHRRGTVRVSDCTVRIHGSNGGSLNQEFSEAKHLVFAGTNTIITESSANTVFWHPLGGSLKLENDASLNVTSPNTSALYGIFYADSPLNTVSVTIGERAALDMTISGVVAPEAYVKLSSFTVREGGGFYLKSTKAVSAPVLRVSGDITVMRDSVFHLTAQSASSELINLAGGAFICNDPASVLLYNANRVITASGSPGQVYIDAQQVNHWTELNPGGLDAPEGAKWYKPDGANFVLDGTLQTGSGGNFSAITSNYAEGDPPGYPPSGENFSMITARVLAFGRIELALARPAANSHYVSGVTTPGAVVRVSFTQEGTEYILPDTTAGSDGVFHLPTGIALREGTVINAKCAWQYLTASDKAVVAGAGRLEFFVPDTMDFYISEISAYPQMIRRLHPGWEVVVSDSRGVGGGFRIFAQLSRELTPGREDLQPVPGAFVFKEPGGGQSVMSPSAPTLIVSHTTQSEDEIFPITWREDEGVLLRIEPGTVYAGTVYSAAIIWTLVDGP